jgi:Calcineurin-like phosphoesterase
MLMGWRVRPIRMRLIFCCAVIASLARAGVLTPVWVELGPDGQALARVVVDSEADCPSLEADGKPLAMKVRDGLPSDFKPACEATVPPNAKTLRWRGRKLPLPKTPRNVIVMGDTGCRVKGSAIQKCDDPTAWPLKAVAEQISKARPDLIIHVGDYLYRESPCPNPSAGCEGPYGDNWLTWNADFFAPASAALGAAAWMFSRGNHESCSRAYRGWFYYLYPGPFPATCGDSKPYVAQSGRLRVGMLDSASTLDFGETQEQLQRIAADLGAFSGRVDWIADHHPFWGFNGGAGGANASVSAEVLEPAWEKTKFQGVRLILSGHVHLFEFLVGSGDRPNQLIAGDSGTQLDAGISGAAVSAGTIEHDFGFTQLQRTGAGWNLTLKNSHGAPLVRCTLPDSGAASCSYLQSSMAPARAEGPSELANPLTVDGNWRNFIDETASPLTLGGGVFNAGTSYLTHSDPKYGRSPGAFGEIAGASMADIATQNFFADFLLASWFREDPRYFRRGPDYTTRQRITYAVSRSVLTKTDAGATVFNWSNVLGTGMSAALSNAYYPPVSRGANSTFIHIGLSVMGTGLAKLAPEFWPDIRQKFSARHR